LPDFLANGDIMEVVRLRNIHEQYGFHFADATLRLPDYDDAEIDCRVLLSTLGSESPSLTQEESEKLFQAVYDDYFDIPSKRERMKKLREDPYYNALQLKYAYAVTCHKAQGGQWEHVYIDQGYLTEDMADISYLRWLYTAFTRTSEQVFLVNWPKEQQKLVVGEEEVE
jgi:exodeoxyribonuclease-5